MEDDEDTEGEVFVYHHDKVRGWGYIVGGAMLSVQYYYLLGYYSNW